MHVMLVSKLISNIVTIYWPLKRYDIRNTLFASVHRRFSYDTRQLHGFLLTQNATRSVSARHVVRTFSHCDLHDLQLDPMKQDFFTLYLYCCLSKVHL
jgi:hypothetical protein